MIGVDGNHAPRGPFVLNRDSPQAKDLQWWVPLISDETGAREFVSGKLPTINERVTEVRKETGSSSTQWNGSAGVGRIRGYPSFTLSIPYTITALCMLETTEGFGSVFSSQADSTDFVNLQQNNSGELVSAAGVGPVIKINELVLLSVTGRGSVLKNMHQISLSSGHESIEHAQVPHSGTFFPQIGNDRDWTTRRWKGPIFDLRIYGRAISDTELRQLFNASTRWDLYDVGITRTHYPINFKPPSRAPRIAPIRGGSLSTDGFRFPKEPFVRNQDSPQNKGLLAWWPAQSAWQGKNLFDLSGKGNGPLGQSGEVPYSVSPQGAFRGPETSTNETSSGLFLTPTTLTSEVSSIGGAGVDFSVCLVLKIIQSDAEGNFFNHGASNGSSHCRVVGKTSESSIRLMYFNSTNSLDLSVTTGDLKLFSDLIFVTAVVSRSTLENRLYVQGGQFFASGALTDDAGVSLSKHAFGGESARWLHAIYADIRYYNYALSAAEAAAMYDPDTRWDLYHELNQKTYVRVPPEYARIGKIIRAGPTFVDGSHAPR